jgi:glycosyltransferase involved in cell wall biosynthesis
MVRALRQLGHEVLMLPVYLPLTVDEADESAGVPVFFGGINVYLQQHWPLFARAPQWLLRALSSRAILKLAAGRAASTQPGGLGDLTLSMLRGEAGNQARELDEMVAWLQRQFQPQVVILSNALLIGMARRLKEALGCKVVCQLAGEDSFLDSLPGSYRAKCWQTVSERAREADVLTAPSCYFASLMSERLGIAYERIELVRTGINLEGFSPPDSERALQQPPVLGFFTRMCREKGLDLLVDAFLHCRRSGRAPGLRLKVGGYCGPGDREFVHGLQRKLAACGLADAAEFHPNVDRAGKLALLGSLSVFSAPAVYGEAFGLYLVEAMAAGVPVVQPDTAAFPELIAATGGGVLCKANDPVALAAAIEELLSDPARASAMGRAGAGAVARCYSAEAMALSMQTAINRAVKQPA